MYNRYIPQQDGTYRRRPMPDAPPGTPPQPPCPPEPAPMPGLRPQMQSRRPEPACQGQGVGSFLRNLLPGDFDTGDLLVLLLLLLMAGDRPEDKNTALLTLVLYLFL